MHADITADEARAKGYMKGKRKKEEVFTLLKRTTTPTTIYKKQKLDRDDVVDITDFDVVAWLKMEMRMMLDEEIARAILVGDGRLADSDDKINETCIRPISKDDDLYCVKAPVSVAAAATEDDIAKAFIKTVIKSRKEYKGSGSPTLFTTEDVITNCLLLEDKNGRVIYDTVDKLATALRVKEISIENAVDQRSSMVMVSLKPEPIPLDLKVILIGNANIYQTLLAMDSDFRKLFKIKVEFEDDAPLNNENANKLAQIIHGFCEVEQLPHLDKGAMARLVEYASKLAGSHKKLSTRFDDLIKVAGEAATWAKMSKSKVVTSEFVDKALAERVERVKKFDAKYMDMIKDHSLLIDTTGFEVGTINGLTILTIGDYSFGKPAKITVNTYTGKNGIVNIEREVELSGSTHSKGVLILSGYLGEMFAQDIPLCLTASICFEQLYNGVDGDSASSTELYGLLSSLSGIPINQAIAVTGSVNQKGQIQPIGGVNEKIEGYFQICKMRGLTGEHGVMIPVQNVDNLQLSDEIVSAVKKGLFHVYAVSTIEEGIEVLTGVPAGKKDKNGRFPAGTVNYLVYEKLKKYAKVSYEK